MALTLATAHSSARSDGSSSSDEGSVPPQTPNSPTNHGEILTSGSQKSLNNISNNNTNNNSNSSTNTTGGSSPSPKKKASRRANTAERRATHNAVERARRETLNGRFLDLAALLPNLSQIRRPSKSAIVNSSIAHIHSARRHRHLASRELRILKSEADALRRELNDWRDRAGLSRVEEPVRSEGFGIVLSGEVEAISLSGSPGMLEEDDGAFDGFDECDEDFVMMRNPSGQLSEDGDDQMAAAAMPKVTNTSPAATFGNPNASVPGGALAHPHVIPRGPGPMIAQMPSSVSFENPVMPAMYEPQAHYGGAYFVDQGQRQQSQQQQQLDTDKITPWTACYSNPNPAATTSMPACQGQQQRAMVITPPTHTGSPSAAEQAQILAGLKRQQQFLAMQHQMSYGVVESDDATSVLSSRSGSDQDMGEMHARSGSASIGYGTPPHGSSPVMYDAPVAYDSSVRYEQMGNMSGGIPMATGMGMGVGVGMDMMMKQSMAVGGYTGMM